MSALEVVRSQQFRSYAYGVAAAAVAVLGAYGFLSDGQVGPWLILAAAVVGVPGLAGASHYAGAGYTVKRREPATPVTPVSPADPDAA